MGYRVGSVTYCRPDGVACRIRTLAGGQATKHTEVLAGPGQERRFNERDVDDRLAVAFSL